MTENIFFSLIMKYLLFQTDRWKEVKLQSLKNVRCETSVLFLIERSFNRGAIGYVPSFSLKVVFFFIFFKLWRQGSSYPPRKTFCDSLDAIWPRHDFVSFG